MPPLDYVLSDSESVNCIVEHREAPVSIFQACRDFDIFKPRDILVLVAKRDISSPGVVVLFPDKHLRCPKDARWLIEPIHPGLTDRLICRWSYTTHFELHSRGCFIRKGEGIARLSLVRDVTNEMIRIDDSLNSPPIQIDYTGEQVPSSETP